MKLGLAVVCLLASTMAAGQSTSRGTRIVPMRYSWKMPENQQGSRLQVSNLIEGVAHDFEYFKVTACYLMPSPYPLSLEVPYDAECVLIVKSGSLKISFRDSTWSLGPASVAVLMPGEKYSVQSVDVGSQYYFISYQSKELVDMARGVASGGSFVRDWNKVKFRAHDRGGVRSYFERPTAMCSRLEMHVTTLKPGLKSHDPHTHRAEEIILMLEDSPGEKARTEMLIGDKFFQGNAGDLYYVGTGLLHGIKNIGETTCSYFAFQFE